MSYVHTQNLSHHRAFHASAAFLNCLAISVSTSAWYRVLSVTGESCQKGSQSMYADFPASPTSQRAGHPQANDPKTSYIISTSLDIITALLLYKKHEELT